MSKNLLILEFSPGAHIMYPTSLDRNEILRGVWSSDDSSKIPFSSK